MKKDTPKTEPVRVVTVRPNGKRRVQIFNREPSLTQQQFKDEVNVNNIMKKYQQTRQVTHLNHRAGKFADITKAEDYFESMNRVSQAREAFEQLPSDVRRRFANDPAELLKFVHDPKNYEEGVRLGIFDPKQPSPDGSIPPLSNPPNQSTPNPNPLAPKNDESNDEKTKAPKK